MDDAVDALYSLPPAEFTAVRDDLAKRLRVDGDKDTAAAVKALRRPTVAAFALNLAAHSAREELEAVLGAADALRDAHEALLSGRGDARAVRSASEDERAAAGAFVAEAVRLAEQAGQPLSEAAVVKVRETVHAAALDDEVRGALAAGRLEREVEAASGGLFGGPAAGGRAAKSRASTAKARGSGTPRSPGTGAGTGRAAPAKGASGPGPTRGQREAARRALAAAERDLKKAEGGAKAARTRLDDAETAAEQARERLERAEAELGDARERCERAQAELRAAKEAVARAHEEAQA